MILWFVQGKSRENCFHSDPVVPNQEGAAADPSASPSLPAMGGHALPVGRTPWQSP